MQQESSHGAATRKRVAENVYRRRTKRDEVVYELVFRDVDGKQRMRKLAATGERAAIREARAILAGRDNGDRVVAAEITISELAERDYFPMLESLAAVGRRSERGVEDDRDRYRLHVKPRLGDMRLGDVQPRHIGELIAAMRARKPKPYAEATIDNVLAVIRALYRMARSRGYVIRSPIDGLDPAELPKPTVGGAGRVLDELELAALVRGAADLPAAYRAGVTLLAYSGLRLSEALGLRWCDVDLIENEIHVRGQLQPRRGDRDVRWIPRLKSEAGARVVVIFPPSQMNSSGCSSSSWMRVGAATPIRCFPRGAASRSTTATSPCAASRRPRRRPSSAK